MSNHADISDVHFQSASQPALNRIIYQVVSKCGYVSPPAVDPGRDMTIGDAILEAAKMASPAAVHKVNLTTRAVTSASLDVALAWWKILAAEGVDPDGRVPPFIRLHLTRDQMWAEIIEG